MNIETENYVIKSDKYQFILYKKTTVKDKESQNHGKRNDVLVGYYTSANQLVSGAIKHGVAGDDLTTIEQVKEAVSVIKSELEITKGI